MKRITLKFIESGKWEMMGNQHYHGRVFAVLVNHRPRVYELQDELGNLLHGDGFESLAHIRAFYNQEWK